MRLCPVCTSDSATHRIERWIRGLRPGLARDHERDTEPDGDILVTVKLVKLGTACIEKEVTAIKGDSTIVSLYPPHHSSLTH